MFKSGAIIYRVMSVVELMTFEKIQKRAAKLNDLEERNKKIK